MPIILNRDIRKIIESDKSITGPALKLEPIITKMQNINLNIFSFVLLFPNKYVQDFNP